MLSFLKKIFLFSVCLTILTVTLSYSPVFTSSVKAYAGNNGIYSYTLGRNISYSALIDFEYNTVSIDMQSTQGFLDSNDVIMVPYDIVYGTNGANFTLARDTEKNSVTISDGKNTLKMTIGKTKARLNGHIYYLDAAPQIVMYKKSIKKRLVVPARSVSEAFGLYYNYSSDNEIVSVARKYNFSIEGRKFTFKDLSCGVEINGKEINLSSLPVLVINNVAYMRAITVFKTGLGADVDIDSSTGKISITMNGKTIVMYEGSSTAYLDGTAVDIAGSPKYVTNLDNGYSALLIPGDYVAEYLEADCRFDLDKKMFYFTANGDTLNYHNRYVNNSTDDSTADNSATDNSTADGSTADGNTADNSTADNSTADGSTADGSTADGSTADGNIADNSQDLAIHISLPDGVNFSSTKIRDLYSDNELILEIPGNYYDYYNKNLPQNPFKNVESVDVSYDDDSDKTELIFTTSVIQGYVYSYMDNNTARLFIAEPEECYANIVVVDPGHGDTDPGTTKSIYNEKNINLRTAFFLYDYLTSNGVKVYLTRTDDTLVDLYDREELAAMTEADVFLSLHVNSANSSSAKGTGVYYCKSNNSENPNGLTSKKLAQKLAKSVSSVLSTKNNGAIAGDFVVIRECEVPAVLVEVGYLSNYHDRCIITRVANNKKTAQAISKTLLNLLK